MPDLEIIAMDAAQALRTIAEQASRLGTGLQNAAPAEKGGVSNNSIQYLFAVSDALNTVALECAKLGPAHTQDVALKK